MLNFRCHGNTLGSLKNSGRIFEFTYPEKPTIHAKNFSISKLVPFWLLFAQIWLPWQLPWLPEKFR